MGRIMDSLETLGKILKDQTGKKEEEKPRKACHSFKPGPPVSFGPCKFQHVTEKGKVLVPEKRTEEKEEEGTSSNEKQ